MSYSAPPVAFFGLMNITVFPEQILILRLLCNLSAAACTGTWASCTLENSLLHRSLFCAALAMFLGRLPTLISLPLSEGASAEERTPENMANLSCPNWISPQTRRFPYLDAKTIDLCPAIWLVSTLVYTSRSRNNNNNKFICTHT